MKWDTSSSLKCVAITVLLVVTIQTGYTQSKSASPQKSSGKEITISIAGIEYDDAGFMKLRETIKQNMKVKDVNMGYSGGLAKISCMYSGKATELWDELPQSIKQPFKISAIDNNHIELQKNTQKLTETSLSTTSNTTKKEEDCVNCTYFKSCNFDTTANFDGVLYKGVKSGSQKGFYYYCSSGSLLRKYMGPDKKFYTQTLIKSNEPVGTSWSYTVENGKIYRHATVSKGISIKVGGIIYNDVIIVYDDYVTLFRNDYYAKDIGIVKSDTLDKMFDPLKAATMLGKVDQTITGTWKHHNLLVDMNLYYKFNGDGTYEYYVGSVQPTSQMPKGKCYWRVNGEILELYTGEWNVVVRLSIQKKNDAATGKPVLVIQSGEKESRTYFSEEGKTAWK